MVSSFAPRALVVIGPASRLERGCSPLRHGEYNVNLPGSPHMFSLITGSPESSADAAPTVAGLKGNDRLLVAIIMDVPTARPDRPHQNCDDRLRAQQHWIVVDR